MASVRYEQCTRYFWLTMYYWRVCAMNNAPDTSGWSETWQFHTTDHVVSTSNTLNDTSTTATYYTRINFYWKNSRGSTKYLLQIDTTPNFGSPILREIYTTNAIDNETNELGTTVYNLLYGTMYYWRVCAMNNAPDTSGWLVGNVAIPHSRQSLFIQPSRPDH